MISMMRIKTSLYFFIILAASHVSTGKRTTCTFPPAVVGEEARLTCHFGIDVTSTSPRLSIKVRRNDHNDIDYKRDTVLDCGWTGDDLNCITIKDGFHFDYNVSDKLVLEVPSATLDYSGKYVCQLVGSGLGVPEACVFTVENTTALPDVGLYKDIGSSCVIHPVLKGENATLQCQFTKDLNTTQTGFAVYRTSPDKSQQAVLDCYWEYKGSLKCDHLASGYKFNYNVSNRINITLSEAADQFVGIYTCQVAKGSSADAHNCSFTLEAEPATADKDVITIVVPAVVAILVIAILVIAVVIIVIFLCRRRRKGKGHEQAPITPPVALSRVIVPLLEGSADDPSSIEGDIPDRAEDNGTSIEPPSPKASVGREIGMKKPPASPQSQRDLGHKKALLPKGEPNLFPENKN